MSKQALIVIVLALILGAVAAVYVRGLIRSRGPSGVTEKVVVAVRPIALGQVIQKDQVELADLPKKILPSEGTHHDLSNVIGRVSRVEVAPGGPILESWLAPKGVVPGLSAVIPEGMRAMTVKVDEVIGVAGFVLPGTYVDVVVTVMRSGFGEESTARIVLQNVKVLASGEQIENKKDGSPVKVTTVTLQVGPEQAEKLALASNAGKLQLVMRGGADREAGETEGVTISELLEGTTQSSAPRTQSNSPGTQRPPVARNGPPKAPVAPLPPETVEIILGTQRSTVPVP